FWQRHSVRKRDAHPMRACRSPKPDSQILVHAQVVELPLFIPSEISKETERRRMAVRSADCELPNARAIEPRFDLLRFGQADDVVVVLASELDLEQVLAVDREVVSEG